MKKSGINQARTCVMLICLAATPILTAPKFSRTHSDCRARFDLFLSKSLYLSSVDDFYKGRGSRYLEWMRRAVTNVQEGALTFHYAVTATTNFLSWTFPRRFEFFQKGRDFLQNEGWFKHGVGTLKSIRAAAAPKNLFDPNMHQTIVDWRFYDEATGMNANIYSWSNSFVPLTQDPALQAKFKARVEKARRHKDGGQ